MADTVATSPIETDVQTERQIAYFYTDKNVKEEWPIYEAKSNSWWMDGGVKLHQLMDCFKRGDNVRQACYSTGITYEQYRAFRLLHDWIPQAILTYKNLVPLNLKNVILRAALGTKEVRNEAGKIVTPAVEPNAKIALGAYRIFEVEEDDPDFTKTEKGLIPLGGSSTTIVAQEIKDAQGKVVMSKRALEITQSHDRNNGDSTG